MNSLPIWLSTTIIGFGTVFIGLILLIFLTKLMGICLNRVKKQEQPLPVNQEPAVLEAADRGAMTAAIAAAIATTMGKDVQGIRIHSIKKLSH